MEVDQHLSSEKWLKVHGLAANGLSLSQILCSLGFQQCSGEVQCLGHPVTSQYCTGLFLQHPDQTGRVYNLVDADEERLHKVEANLTSAICRLKQRLQWLNSGSRKPCGVLSERKVLLVLIEGGPTTAKETAVSLLQDQGSYLTHLNIIRGSSMWKQQLMEVQEEVVTEAIQWLLNDTKPSSSNKTISILKEAISHNQIEAMYVIAEGNSSIREEVDDLTRQLQHSSLPVHVVVVDCKCPNLLKSCQDLASACGGRCHSDGGKKETLCLPRPDVLDIWQELEQARDTLAQVQALCMEVAEKTKTYYDCTAKTESKQSNKKKYGYNRHLADSKTKIPQASKREGTESTTCSTGKKARRRVTVGHNQVSSKQKTRPSSDALAHSLEVQHRGGCRMPVVGTVLACCKQDGFYYKGNVIRTVSRQSVVVRFLDHSLQTTLLNHLMPVGGAGPHPQLRREDYVLCCVRERQGRHCSEYGVCDFYIPAQVQVVPRESGHTLFSVTTFKGEHVSCTRSSLKKIPRTQYLAICSSIAECQQQITSQPMAGGNVASHSEELHRTEDDSGDHHRPLEQAANSPPQNEEDSKETFSEEDTPVSVCKDMATATDVLETIERGTSMSVLTQEQAVGTGPQMVDHSTTTDNDEVQEHTFTEGLSSSPEQGIEASSSDAVDYSPPEHGVGREVFCCLPETGWYYRASVLGRGATEASWIVKTELGEVANISASHTIPVSYTSPIIVGSTVLAPHPLFPASFAPGSVLSVDSQRSRCSMAFYDGLKADIPRNMIHSLSPAEHKEAVVQLQERDNHWIGQAVIARRESDGVYYPAMVTKKLEGQCYQVRWTDGSHQTQSRLHVFGCLSSRKSPHAGDHVLALAMSGLGACLPGTVTGTQSSCEDELEVRFSDGERQMVPRDQCFWISPAYFISAVEYISKSFSQSHALCQ